MRYLLMLVAVGALMSAGVAEADAPRRVVFPVGPVTFEEFFMSAACGTTVYLTLDGTIKATLFVDKNDNIIREIDTQPAARLTYSNDAGDSISFPWTVVSHSFYFSGTAVGSPATVILTGNMGPFTGLVGPGTGRLVLSGTVVDVLDGVPLTAFTDVVSMSGNFTGQTTRICAALS